MSLNNKTLWDRIIDFSRHYIEYNLTGNEYFKADAVDGIRFWLVLFEL